MRAILAALAFLLAPQALAEELRLLDEAGEIFGFEAVGRLDFAGADGSRGFCTATLVSPRRVLTAAHCLVDEDGRPRPPGEMTFRPGLRGGADKGTHSITAYAMHPGYERGTGPTVESVSTDVALLALERGVDYWAVPPLRADGALGKGRRVQVVSYARGRADAPSHEESCTVLSRDAGILSLTCQATFGASGAPVFVATGQGARIVGVVSSGGRWRDRDVTYAAPVGDVVARLERALPRGAAPARIASPGARTLRVGDRGGQGGSIQFHRPGG